MHSLISGAARPPMHVRNSEAVHKQLGADALPKGFVASPTFTQQLAGLADDLEYAGCSFVNDVDGYRFTHDSTYVNQ